MLTTSFLSMWLSNTASTAMMLPIANAILKSLFGEKDTSKDMSRENEETQGNWDRAEVWASWGLPFCHQTCPGAGPSLTCSLLLWWKDTDIQLPLILSLPHVTLTSWKYVETPQSSDPHCSLNPPLAQAEDQLCTPTRMLCADIYRVPRAHTQVLPSISPLIKWGTEREGTNEGQDSWLNA